MDHARYVTGETVCGNSERAYWPPDAIRDMVGARDHTGAIHHERLFTDEQIAEARAKAGNRCVSCLLLVEHYSAPADDSEPTRYPGEAMTRAIQARHAQALKAKEETEE